MYPDTSPTTTTTTTTAATPKELGSRRVGLLVSALATAAFVAATPVLALARPAAAVAPTQMTPGSQAPDTEPLVPGPELGKAQDVTGFLSLGCEDPADGFAPKATVQLANNTDAAVAFKLWRKASIVKNWALPAHTTGTFSVTNVAWEDETANWRLRTAPFQTLDSEIGYTHNCVYPVPGATIHVDCAEADPVRVELTNTGVEGTDFDILVDGVLEKADVPVGPNGTKTVAVPAPEDIARTIRVEHAGSVVLQQDVTKDCKHPIFEASLVDDCDAGAVNAVITNTGNEAGNVSVHKNGGLGIGIALAADDTTELPITMDEDETAAIELIGAGETVLEEDHTFDCAQPQPAGPAPQPPSTTPAPSAGDDEPGPTAPTTGIRSSDTLPVDRLTEMALDADTELTSAPRNHDASARSVLVLLLGGALILAGALGTATYTAWRRS